MQQLPKPRNLILRVSERNKFRRVEKERERRNDPVDSYDIEANLKNRTVGQIGKSCENLTW